MKSIMTSSVFTFCCGSYGRMSVAKDFTEISLMQDVNSLKIPKSWEFSKVGNSVGEYNREP